MLGTVLVGRYRIITTLGAGGFGQTFLAEDTQLPGSPCCVVKQFKPVTRDTKSLEIARRLFHKEVEVLERLGQHDQIPSFLDFFEEKEEFYLVQEFIDGQPLSEEFAFRRLNETQAIDLLQDVLSVLEFVHHNRVIHRDIKPGNLIRRYRDSKIVLIDFGAVKEIQTQIVSDSGQNSFTIGIGTQGYTPTEQLSGKPRFCSDLYALGMTVIQGLTGLQPSQLPEDPSTSEYLWQDRIDISPGLTIILDRMVRFHYSQRYQSAEEVLQALQKLSELPTDLTEVPPSLLLPEFLLHDDEQTVPELVEQHWLSKLKIGLKVVAIATVTVTSLVLGIRQLGWLELSELSVFDRMVQLRPQLPPDPRLLIVEITEADLQTLNRPTPSDQDVAKVMANLLQLQAKVVGLDLHRDLPQEPGQRELLRQLQNPKAIAIMNLGSPNSRRIPPPPGVPADRIGFNDLPIDPDGIVRRNLMFASLESESYYSFSLRLALKYLSEQGITPLRSSINADYVQLGEVVFIPLKPNSGAYQNEDTAGYQILLNYRSAGNVARRISFMDVLRTNIDPDWVKDKIVLIGTTAPSAKDLFNTPYITGQREDLRISGVVVHAQMLSQFLSAVLDERPLFWFWSEWVEMLWIAGWAIVGGSVGWFVRHPIGLGLSGVIVIVFLSTASFSLFLQQGWVPVVAPAIAATITGGAVIIYRAYQMQQEQQAITRLWSSRNSSSGKSTRRVSAKSSKSNKNRDDRI
jgi:CHASE2 domain-containing sensor protein